MRAETTFVGGKNRNATIRAAVFLFCLVVFLSGLITGSVFRLVVGSWGAVAATVIAQWLLPVSTVSRVPSGARISTLEALVAGDFWRILLRNHAVPFAGMTLGFPLFYHWGLPLLVITGIFVAVLLGFAEKAKDRVEWIRFSNGNRDV